MIKYIPILFLASLALSASAAASENQLKATALTAVEALFLTGDHQAFLELLDPKAERKNLGEGSAVESLRKQKVGVFTQFNLSEIIFVTEQNIPTLKETYPNDMWDDNRIPSHLDFGIGCLVLIDLPQQEKKGMSFFVVREIDGRNRITYLDDN